MPCPPIHKTEEEKQAAGHERRRRHYAKQQKLRLTKPSQEVQEIQKSLAIALGHDEDETSTSELEIDDDENDTLSPIIPTRFEKHQGRDAGANQRTLHIYGGSPPSGDTSIIQNAKTEVECLLRHATFTQDQITFFGGLSADSHAGSVSHFLSTTLAYIDDVQYLLEIEGLTELMVAHSMGELMYQKGAGEFWKITSMPGISWQTREQSTWLKSKVDGFRQSRVQDRVGAYLVQIYLEWFQQWPEIPIHFKDPDTGVPLLKEEQLMKAQMELLGKLTKQCEGQLRSYLYRAASHVGTKRVTEFTKSLTKMMAPSTSCTHGPTAVEHFLNTEYKDDPTVKQKVNAELKESNYSGKTHIAGLRMVAAKLMAERGDEYMKIMEIEAKTECELHAEKAKVEAEAFCNPTESMRTQFIEGLPGVVGQLLNTIHEMTSWHASIYLGGPDPHAAGEVHVFSFHHGKNTTGFNFCDTILDRHTCIVEPYTTFLKGAFSRRSDSVFMPDLSGAPSMASNSTTSVDPYWTSAGSSQILPAPGASLPVPQSSVSSMADMTPVPKDDMHLGEIRPLSHGLLLNPSLIAPLDVNAFNNTFSLSQDYGLSFGGTLMSSDNMQLPRLPSAMSQEEPDSPISSWNREHQAGWMQSPPRLRGALSQVASASADFQIPRPSGGGVEQGSWYDFCSNLPQEQPSAPPSIVPTPTEHESVLTDPEAPSTALTAHVVAGLTTTPVTNPACMATPKSTAPHLDDPLEVIINPACVVMHGTFSHQIFPQATKCVSNHVM
ncbi:hypothetical protein F4604DRAFT_1907870 [Suillus subluteus]|nr:hypothetical protein F4604DRAFT_1907870 [Suillus subluteus]